MIPPIERKAIVELLVQRKFPPMVLAGLSGKRQPTDATTLSRILRHEEIKGYRGELEALPENELQELFRTEQAKLIEEAQREEQLRFFHQPHAAADFDHWSKAEHWSLEEAVALAMGKAPEIVSWPKIDSYVQVSPFVQRYRRLRDLAHRAVP
jgi:hypothetical protein